MENMIRYYGTEIENGESVIEAFVDNIIINIRKQDNDFVVTLAENNYDSTIEYDEYTLDEYEAELLEERESCYEFLVEFFEQYSCSYGIM